VQVPSSATKYAASHHGLVTRSKLIEADLSDGQVARLVRNDHLIQVHRGVYRLPGAPESWEQRMLAACLVTGGAASHRSAQRIWDPDAPPVDPAGWPVEVTVPRPRSPRAKYVTVHRSSDLDLSSCPTRQKVPVTTPMRMLMDLGVVAPVDEVSAALEKLVLKGTVPLAAVRNELAARARSGRTGTGALRQVLAEWPDVDAQAGSPAELLFARLCRREGLPEPVYQYEVALGGRRRRIDFAYPDRRLAIEIDGHAVHAQRNVFQDDRHRQNDLIEAGWRVIRFTWHDVSERRDYVVATVRRMLSVAE
jgi:very-short-patch-repair endonuclease